MNKSLVVCLLVILGAGSAAFATTTSQIWYFETDALTPAADVVNNPNGDPLLQVVPGPGGWLEPGIWSLSGEIDIIIPNDPTLRERKEIQLELLWAPGGQDPFLPDRPLVGVSAVPMDALSMAVTDEPAAGGDWILSTYQITIWPNPPEEWIAIKGDILVDQIAIETKCVPEPATLGLLSLGAVTLLRYSRKR